MYKSNRVLENLEEWLFLSPRERLVREQKPRKNLDSWSDSNISVLLEMSRSSVK